MRRAGLFQVEAALKPALGGHAAVALFGTRFFEGNSTRRRSSVCFEIEQQLAGCFHSFAIQLDADVLAVGVEFELSQWMVDAAQGVKDSADLGNGDAVCAKFDQGT